MEQNDIKNTDNIIKSIEVDIWALIENAETEYVNQGYITSILNNCAPAGFGPIVP